MIYHRQHCGNAGFQFKCYARQLNPASLCLPSNTNNSSAMLTTRRAGQQPTIWQRRSQQRKHWCWRWQKPQRRLQQKCEQWQRFQRRRRQQRQRQRRRLQWQLRRQPAPKQKPPSCQNDSKIGTTAIPMAATLTTTTPSPHALAPENTTNTWRLAPIPWVATCTACTRSFSRVQLDARQRQPTHHPSPQLRTHLQLPYGRQWTAIPYCIWQLCFWTHAGAYQRANNIPPPSARNCHDAQHDGLQQHLPAGTPSHARSSCKTQSGLV